MEESYSLSRGEKSHPSKEQAPAKECTGALAKADGHAPTNVKPTRDSADHHDDREDDGSNDAQGKFNVVERMMHEWGLTPPSSAAAGAEASLEFSRDAARPGGRLQRVCLKICV